MHNLFSKAEIYELKSMIKKQKKSCINNYTEDNELKLEKIKSLDSFNKVLFNMENKVNIKTIKTLK